MKLSVRDAVKVFTQAKSDCAVVLLHGADKSRVAMRRRQIIDIILGPNAEEEMRLTRISAAEVRSDPPILADAVKAVGFFPGARAIVIDDAADGLRATVSAVLDDWQTGDATVVLAAGLLPARSTLRKLIESHSKGTSVGVYDDPPTREELAADIKAAGIGEVGPDAMEAVAALSRDLSPGDFKMTLEKIALYKSGDEMPLTDSDVAACAPMTTEADLDSALDLVTDAKVAELGAVLQRLKGQGITPTALCIGATRHFRKLHAAASHPQGPDVALSRARPPVFGPRKATLARQARHWGAARLENAMRELTDTDLSLRSSRPVPASALIERTLIRIAMMGRR